MVPPAIVALFFGPFFLLVNLSKLVLCFALGDTGDILGDREKYTVFNHFYIFDKSYALHLICLAHRYFYTPFKHFRPARHIFSWAMDGRRQVWAASSLLDHYWMDLDVWATEGLSVCLSVCLSVFLSVCLSICPYVCLSAPMSVPMSAPLSVCPSLCLSYVCMSVCPYVCPSVSLSVPMSVPMSLSKILAFVCVCVCVCVCVYPLKVTHFTSILYSHTSIAPS